MPSVFYTLIISARFAFGSSFPSIKGLLQENMEVLHKSAALLMEKEKIGGEEFEALFVKNA